MKTKIFVCGNSQITYLAKNPSIEAIPVVLSFHNDEDYIDTIDITAPEFYNRLAYDKKLQVNIKFANFTNLCERIEVARAEGFEEILFILGNKEYDDVFIQTKLLKSQYSSIPIHIFSSTAISYPLAYMALSADIMFKNGEAIDAVIKRLEAINKGFEMYFYTPNEDIRYSYPKSFVLPTKVILPKNNRAFKYTNELISMESEKNKHIIYTIFDLIKRNLKGHQLFLLYTDRNTELYRVIKSYLLANIKGLEDIKEYPIPPALGVKLGVYTIGIGLIKVEY